jgi:hypothetical protein
MPVTFTPPPPPPPTIEESLEPNEVVLPTTVESTAITGTTESYIMEAAPYNEFTPDMGVVVAGVILAFVLVRVVLSLLPLILAAGLGFLAFKLF